MRTDLRNHPKIVRMASALKADRLRVVGGLWAVWSIFDTHSVDGLLEGYAAQTIDDDLNWRGFGGAMQAVGWLIESESGLQVPEFDEHNGASAKRRATETKRKQRDRADDPQAHESWTQGRKPSAQDAGQLSASDADILRTRVRLEKEKEVPTVLKDSARARPPPCPVGVPGQVWADWTALRKAKRAPVTDTVIAEASAEAGKAGMTLEAFLREWCVRGSQGLKAEWLRSNAPLASGRGASAHPPSNDRSAHDAEAKRLLFGDKDVIDA